MTQRGKYFPLPLLLKKAVPAAAAAFRRLQDQDVNIYFYTQQVVKGPKASERNTWWLQASFKLWPRLDSILRNLFVILLQCLIITRHGSRHQYERLPASRGTFRDPLKHRRKSVRDSSMSKRGRAPKMAGRRAQKEDLKVSVQTSKNALMALESRRFPF